jgi:hypothetical protein
LNPFSDLFTKQEVENLAGPYHPLADLYLKPGLAGAATASALRRAQASDPRWFHLQRPLLVDPMHRADAAQRLAYIRAYASLHSRNFRLEHLNLEHQVPRNIRAYLGSVPVDFLVAAGSENSRATELDDASAVLSEPSDQSAQQKFVAVLKELVALSRIYAPSPCILWLDSFDAGSWVTPMTRAQVQPFYTFSAGGRFGSGIVWNGLYAASGNSILVLEPTGYSKSRCRIPGIFMNEDYRSAVQDILGVLVVTPSTGALLENPFAARPLQVKTRTALHPLIDLSLSRLANGVVPLIDQIAIDQRNTNFAIRNFLKDHAARFDEVHGLVNPPTVDLQMPDWETLSSGAVSNADHLGDLSVDDPKSISTIAACVVGFMNSEPGYVVFRSLEHDGKDLGDPTVKASIRYLRRFLRRAMRPPAENISVHARRSGNTVGFIVSVPKQHAGPFQLVETGLFPVRRNDGPPHLQIGEISDALLANALLAKDVIALAERQAPLVRQEFRRSSLATLRVTIIPKRSYAFRRDPSAVARPSASLIRPGLDEGVFVPNSDGFTRLIGINERERMLLHVGDDWSFHSAVSSPLAELSFGVVEFEQFRTNLQRFLTSIQEMYDRAKVPGPFSFHIGLYDLLTPSLRMAFGHVRSVRLPFPLMVDRVDSAILIEEILEVFRRGAVQGN